MTHDMTNNSEELRGWLSGRLPQEWFIGSVEVTVDREEITVVGALVDPEFAEGAGEPERTAAQAGRARSFREATREARIDIAREIEHRSGRKVAWGVTVGTGDGARTELWSNISAPVMTRLRQPDRIVLDTLVDAGVARSRADALAWCVRLVGRNSDAWLGELREAMGHVEQVRQRGPGANPDATAGA